MGRGRKPNTARNPNTGPMMAEFNLTRFTNDLILDLKALRAGQISVRDAHARAELARHVLRAVHYVVTAQRYIDSQTKVLPAPAAGEAAD